MIPRDFVLFIKGWNEAHEGNEPEAPSADEYAELVLKYG